MTLDQAREWLQQAVAPDDVRQVLLRALEVAEASVQWVDDIGECHYCDLGEATGHDPDCPVLALLATLKKSDEAVIGVEPES